MENSPIKLNLNIREIKARYRELERLKELKKQKRCAGCTILLSNLRHCETCEKYHGKISILDNRYCEDCYKRKVERSAVLAVRKEIAPVK